MSDRIEKILSQGKRDHDLESPAPEEEVLYLVSNVRFDLPTEYLEFLTTHNGGSGELPIQPCWYELWPASEVVKNNENYEVVKYLSEFLAIGSSQGGELIYIDYRSETKGNIVAIPLIPSDLDYTIFISNSFENLIPLLGFECTCE